MPGSSKDIHRFLRPGALLILATAVPLLVSFLHAIGHLGPSEELKHRAEWESRLSAAADDRKLAVEAWSDHLRRDAELVAGYPTVAWIVDERGGPPFPFPAETGARAHLRELLAGLVETQEYASVWLLSADGRALAASGPGAELPESVALIAGRVQRDRRPALAIVPGIDTGRILAAVPVAGVERGATVVVASHLAPMLKALAREPVPTATGETLLAFGDGERVVFVTPARSGDPIDSLPMTTPDLAMSRALSGGDGLGTFRDHRGRRVIAAVRALTTGWGLVVKIDEDEALAGVRAAKREGALVLGGTLFVAMALGLLAVRQRSALRRARIAEERQHLLAVVERIDEVIFLVDASARIVDALGNVRGLYDVDRADLIGREAAAFRPPEQRPAVTELFARVRADGRSTVETIHVRHDGSRFPVEVTLRHLGAGADPEFIAVVRSLVAREAAEVRLDAVAENFPGCVCLLDRDFVYLLARGRSLADLGLTPAEMEGRSLRDVLPAELVAELEPALRAALDGQPSTLEVPLVGHVHEIRAVPLPAAGRPAESVLLVAQDVTALRRALDEHRRLAAAIEQTQEMVVITDVRGRIEWVNPSFERTTGYAESEVLGRPTSILKSGRHDASFYHELWDTVSRGDVWSGRVVNRRKDGTHYEEDMVISPVRDGASRIVNYVAVKRDVSAQVRLEQELLQAQKMESVGRLAGGVAHDFNNMLSVILGYADMARRGLRPEDPLYARLSEIVRAAERAAGLTRQLLAFSRKQVLQPRVVDLGELVQGLVKMVGRLLGEHVLVRFEPPPQPVLVLVDPGQMEQVVLNLAINARDAMPEGGTLEITLSPSAELARLVVADTGVGMDEATAARIFEPFFTTKEVGKGTGLGLATVYGIVSQSGGHIRVHSAPGRGTTFTIELPLARQPASAPEADIDGATVRGSGTVLLAEDDPAVRAIAADTLRSVGYRVLEAANAGEALLIGEDTATKIDLLVTDVVMPRVNGRDLAARMRARRPDLAVLYTSGFTDDTLSVSEVSRAGSFLQKPFTPDALAREAARALSASRPASETPA